MLESIRRDEKFKDMPVKDTIVVENGEDREYSDDGIEHEDNNNDSDGSNRGSWLRRHVPIVRWLPEYSKFYALSDLIAGITIGLTMIPQSIAYASLAGLTAQYGLYSSFIGGFIYIFLGTIKQVSIGSTSLMALVSLSYTKDMPPDFVILLCFITGCVQLLMGVLDLGFLVDFISIPVTSGFTSAASIIIIVSQLKGLFGLRYRSGNVIDTLVKFGDNFGDIRLADTILGFSSIIFLLLFRKLKDVDCSRFKGSSGNVRSGLILAKVLWVLSIGRNAIAVLAASVIAYNYQKDGHTLFIESGKVVSGLPVVSFPPFSAQVGNQTYAFTDMCHHLGFGLIMVPLIGVLTNVAIAKAFVTDAPVEATQEMLTLGVCNIAGSFFSSMPTCGAFTRSAVSNASGIQTPMAGLYSGILALLALSFLTPFFSFIPKATLAAVLICAVIFLIDVKILRILWGGSKRDALTAGLTFVMSLIFDVETGLFIGTGLNALFLLYFSARPSVEVAYRKTVTGDRYLLIKPEIGLFYPAIDFLGSRITEVAAQRGKGIIPIVVDFDRLQGIDYTAAKGIERLLSAFEGKQQKLYFLNVSAHVRKRIMRLCKGFSFRPIDSEASLIDVLGGTELNKCPTVPVLALTEEKEISINKLHTDLEDKLSNTQENESLLRCDKNSTEKIGETSRIENT